MDWILGDIKELLVTLLAVMMAGGCAFRKPLSFKHLCVLVRRHGAWDLL